MPEYNTATHTARLGPYTNTGAGWAQGWIVEARPLAAAREDAVMSRSEFVLTVFKAGLLSAEDAVSAAKGEWPASFDAALAVLPEQDAVEARILWASALTIERKNALFDAIIAAGIVTGAQVDAIFGIGA